MRTDSVHLSNEAISASRKEIKKLYGNDSLPEKGIQYTKMTAVLLEAIKEQQVQIDELKAKLN
jgi:DNA topoisomerase IA